MKNYSNGYVNLSEDAIDELRNIVSKKGDEPKVVRLFIEGYG